MIEWLPDSWRSRPVKQIPVYPDPAALAAVEARLAACPPLVFTQEVNRLQKNLARVANGEAFLLQGGDCAEIFQEENKSHFYDFLKAFLKMWVILSVQGKQPVVKIGRVAGQFAKPRSSCVEIFNGTTLPSYRGDMINGFCFDQDSRVPDPFRQEIAYRESSSTIGLLREIIGSGLTDTERIREWLFEFLSDPLLDCSRRSLLIGRVASTIDCLDSTLSSPLECSGFYTSHEALVLGYEEALTRRDSDSGQWYATSAHMLWIGNRTRDIDHGHVEYCRGIQNPIGLKCGSDLKADELLRLLDVLDPFNEQGRLTLITRFGSEAIGHYLPSLVRAVYREGRKVIWSCDPMHGNTIIIGGRKTRPFEKILQEIDFFFQIHHAEGTFPGGIHLEMTGKNVTECIGGVTCLTPEKLGDRYHTYCDPRLNLEQSIELSFLVSDFLKKMNRKCAPVPKRSLGCLA